MVEDLQQCLLIQAISNEQMARIIKSLRLMRQAFAWMEMRGDVVKDLQQCLLIQAY